MSSANTGTGSAPAQPGLFARAVGIILSPKDTFGHIAAQPRWFGALATVAVLGAVIMGGFMATEVGQSAWLDQAVTSTERMGNTVSDEQYARMEKMAPYAAYFSGGSMLAILPVGLLVTAGILWAVFNTFLGGGATFKQVFAIVAHSAFVWVVGWVFTVPLNYARESMSSPTNLSVLVPMLDENAFMTRLLGSIDLFMVWWTIVLAIGMAVLYRRRTPPILITFLGIYAVIALGIAAFFASRA